MEHPISSSAPGLLPALAAIQNVHIDRQIDIRHHRCSFDKSDCPDKTQMSKKVKWKGIKHKIWQTSPGGVILSVKISNKDTQSWWDIRKNKYTGFLMVIIV